MHTIGKKAKWSVLLALLAAASTLHATSTTWPAVAAPCNTTLQACVNAQPAGSTVLITANNVTAIGGVGSALVLPRPIMLEAAPGYRPVFPIGSGISADPVTGRSDDEPRLRVAGITLRDAGLSLRVNRSESTVLHFSVERMRFLINNGNGNGSSAIDFEGRAVRPFLPSIGSLVGLDIRDNEYRRLGGPGSFLRVDVRQTMLSGSASFNRIRIPDSIESEYAIRAIASGGSSFVMAITHNDIRGSFSHGAICAVSAGPLGYGTRSYLNIFHNVLIPSVPGIGNAICAEGGEDAFDMHIAQNSIIDAATAISMTVRPAPAPAPIVVSPIRGFVEGNLLAHNGRAWVRDALAALPLEEVGNRSNLLFANTINFAGSAPATAGVETQYANPRLHSRQYPYLRDGSPAIGRGTNRLSYVGFADLDADGSRRMKEVAGGGPHVIDIGAYEYGDNWFNVRAVTETSYGNTVRLSHASLNGLPAARLLATPNFSRGSSGTESNTPFGVYFDAGSMRWALFNQDPALVMPSGAGYSLATPAAGPGLFLHQIAATAPASPETQLDDAAVNAKPQSVIVATSNWNPWGSWHGVYNNHNVAVKYGADSRWRIHNSDGVAFAASSAFNVYAQPSSPSAFRHTARAANIRSMFPGAGTLIDNPRLDNTPCAELMVTPLTSFGNRRFDVYFDGATQRWSIYSPNGMPEGAEFNVVFSPRQVFECMGSAP